jgi:hypothetical protein
MKPASVPSVPVWRSLADDLAAALDPVIFAQRAGIKPFDWQQRVLRSSARQQILCCSRQAGKSTVSATVALHQAVFVSGSLVLLLAPVGRQSRELLAKVRGVYADTSDNDAEADNQVTLELANGSRIVVIPAKQANIRGFSAVSLLVVDEAGFVPDEVYQAVRPMLAVSQGRVVLLSTPNGKRGFYHHEWTEGGEAWERTRITAPECPHIDPRWLVDERRKIPASVFDQEYLCVFGELEDAVFHHEDIHAAISDDVKPLFARREAT